MNQLIFVVFGLFNIKFNSTVSLNLMIIYSVHLNLKAVRVNFYARIFSTPFKSLYWHWERVLKSPKR